MPEVNNNDISKVMSELARRSNKSQREKLGEEGYKARLKEVSKKGVAARQAKRKNNVV